MTQSKHNEKIARLLHRLAREHARCRIHAAGFNRELNTIFDRARIDGCPPRTYMLDWLPVALQLTITRQKTLAAVKAELEVAAAFGLLDTKTVCALQLQCGGIHPELVADSEAPDQETVDGLLAVTDARLRTLDDTATLIRQYLETFNAVAADPATPR